MTPCDDGTLPLRYCSRRAQPPYFFAVTLHAAMSFLPSPSFAFPADAYPLLERFPRLAFVDLETTGATATDDRITEIGIITVDEHGVQEWSSLVNPERLIPPFIQGLTGISDAMVQHAPTFEELADTVAGLLQDRLFIAHNARFDHGFLKNAFRGTGHAFRPPVLCTVRLSRKLFPGFARHNLDALIERHRLEVSERHRALGDARLLWQFWQRVLHDPGTAMLEEAVVKLASRPSLPPALDALQIEFLPETHGVYLFYGAGDVPLYVGKANALRRRVLSHFSGDHLSAREQELCSQIVRIDWIETGGETGALLREAALIKSLQPAFNRQLRRNDAVCSWRLIRRGGRLQALLADTDDLFFAHDASLYGLYGSSRKATDALKAMADGHQLCHTLLGLEKPRAGGCFASQMGRCSGACRGLESAHDGSGEALAQHDERVQAALASVRVQPWPYAGPVVIAEADHFHLVEGWAYLGSARSLTAARELAARGTPRFDRDVYQILRRPQRSGTVLALDGTPLAPVETAPVSELAA